MLNSWTNSWTKAGLQTTTGLGPEPTSYGEPVRCIWNLALPVHLSYSRLLNTSLQWCVVYFISNLDGSSYCNSFKCLMCHVLNLILPWKIVIALLLNFVSYLFCRQYTHNKSPKSWFSMGTIDMHTSTYQTLIIIIINFYFSTYLFIYFLFFWFTSQVCMRSSSSSRFLISSLCLDRK